MDPGVRSHGLKADPPGYRWSKCECFLVSGCWDIPHLRNFNIKLWSNSTTGWNHEWINKRKDKNYIPLGINVGGIIISYHLGLAAGYTLIKQKKSKINKLRGVITVNCNHRCHKFLSTKLSKLGKYFADSYFRRLTVTTKFHENLMTQNFPIIW